MPPCATMPMAIHAWSALGKVKVFKVSKVSKVSKVFKDPKDPFLSPLSSLLIAAMSSSLFFFEKKYTFF